MRLMEVDEAANHIRELVDPDANIIWGSAFNPELEGKIRVSVVATGIDSDAVARPTPQTQPFSFATPVASPAPVSEEPEAEAEVTSEEEAPASPLPFSAPASADSAEEEPMDLAGSEAPTDTPVETDASSGTDTISFPDTPQSEEPKAPVARFDDIDGKDELVLGEDAAVEPAKEEPAPAPAAAKPLGGTLFERMSGLSRGLGKNQDADDEDDEDGSSSVTSFPQFLNRQGNQ